MEYSKVLEIAKELAQKNNLVTPTFAETGFGYIESENSYDVKAFHEKPNFISKSWYV